MPVWKPTEKELLVHIIKTKGFYGAGRYIFTICDVCPFHISNNCDMTPDELYPAAIHVFIEKHGDREDLIEHLL